MSCVILDDLVINIIKPATARLRGEGHWFNYYRNEPTVATTTSFV